MSLSIMPLLTVYSSHPHRHQRQVWRPREHEGVHQHVVPPPPPQVRSGHAPQHLCLLARSLPPRLKAPHITLTTTEELQLGRFSGHVFFWYHALRTSTALSKHQDPV